MADSLERRMRLLTAARRVVVQAERVLTAGSQASSALPRTEEDAVDPHLLSAATDLLTWDCHCFLIAAARFHRCFELDDRRKPANVPASLSDASTLRDVWEHSDEYPIIGPRQTPKKQATRALLKRFEVDGHHNTGLAFTVSIADGGREVTIGQTVSVNELARFASRLLEEP